VAALHAAVRSIAIRSNDANAERGAGWTRIAFRARRAGRPRIALGPLTLTATHHCAGQRHRNEHSQHLHGLPSEEGATGCPISRSGKRPTARASRQNAVGDRGAVSYKYGLTTWHRFAVVVAKAMNRSVGFKVAKSGMETVMTRKMLTGSFVALITPFNKDG